MPAETDIVNVALRLIGEERITSLGDGSKASNAADDIYTEVRDDLLRSHNWNFATKRVKLARSSTAPGFEYEYAYPLPSDWLRTIAAYDNDSGVGTLLYTVEEVAEQRCIVTSADEVYLRYVYRVTDPNVMASDFRRALSERLAADLAIAVASSNTLSEKLTKQARSTLARARSSDASGAFPERRPRGSWASSRGGWLPRIEGD